LPNSDEYLLTASEAALRLRVTLPRLYELVRSGTIPVVRIGRQVRIPSNALQAWIAVGGKSLSGTATFLKEDL
jgi:excisionase family DNA binding protein